MFICSVRASTIKFFSAVALSLVVLITLLSLVEPAAVATGGELYTENVVYSGIKTNEDRVSFLSGLGWTVKAQPIYEKTFVMPESFDRVMQGYNEIQRSQGLDLSKYRKRRSLAIRMKSKIMKTTEKRCTPISSSIKIA